MSFVYPLSYFIATLNGLDLSTLHYYLACYLDSEFSVLCLLLYYPPSKQFVNVYCVLDYYTVKL